MSFLPRILLLSFLTLFLAGCASDGSLVNPFDSSEEPQPTSPYFFSEFPDVPIPNTMSEERGDTYISFSPSGMKGGVQRFTGRVEVVSLMNTMRRNMSSSGWALRSLLRSKESIMVFEKNAQVCTMYITDGMIYTEMRLFMSPRLEGDSPNAEFSAYSQPSGSGASSAAKSSGGSSQKLSQ